MTVEQVHEEVKIVMIGEAASIAFVAQRSGSREEVEWKFLVNVIRIEGR